MSKSSVSPRPILKQTHSDERRHSPPFPHGVHFPPSPTLARTFDAYSSSTYDRSPIVVSPNSCALPARGCPGRTYAVDEHSFSAYSMHVKKTVITRGEHAHPRLLHSSSSLSYCHSESPPSLPPPLIPDLSSESEESDGFISPPHPSFSRRPSASPSSSRNDKYPLLYTYHPEIPSSIIPSSPSVRRRRSSRERERIWSSPVLERQEVDDPGYEDDFEFSSHSPPSPNTRSKKHRTRGRTPSTFGVQDDAGCLGGF